MFTKDACFCYKNYYSRREDLAIMPKTRLSIELSSPLISQKRRVFKNREKATDYSGSDRLNRLS